MYREHHHPNPPRYRYHPDCLKIYYMNVVAKKNQNGIFFILRIVWLLFLLKNSLSGGIKRLPGRWVGVVAGPATEWLFDRKSYRVRLNPGFQAFQNDVY
jgi:hypothetical protein